MTPQTPSSTSSKHTLSDADMSIESPLRKIMLSGGKAGGPMLREIVGGAYISSLRTITSTIEGGEVKGGSALDRY